jgi:hypothetical protein
LINLKSGKIVGPKIPEKLLALGEAIEFRGRAVHERDELTPDGRTYE